MQPALAGEMTTVRPPRRMTSVQLMEGRPSMPRYAVPAQPSDSPLTFPRKPAFQNMVDARTPSRVAVRSTSGRGASTPSSVGLAECRFELVQNDIVLPDDSGGRAVLHLSAWAGTSFIFWNSFSCADSPAVQSRLRRRHHAHGSCPGALAAKERGVICRLP